MSGPTLVQETFTTAASGTTLTATYGTTPIAGNLLDVYVNYSTGGTNNAAGDYAFTDTAANSWVNPGTSGAYLADNPGGGRTGAGEMVRGWVGNCKTHASNVVTLTESGGVTSVGIVMVIAEWSGILKTNNPARNVNTGNQAAGGSLTTPTATVTSGIGDLVTGWISGDNGQTAQPGGWSLVSNAGGGGAVAQYLVTTTGTTTAVVGNATDDGWAVVGVSFIPQTIPLTSYPDRFPFAPRTNVEPGAFNPPRVAAAVVAPTVAYWSYPDRMQQPHRTALETAFFNPPPVVAARLSDAAPARKYTAYPDRIDLPPSNLRSEWVTPPAPVVAAHLKDAAPIGARTSYPDRVDRAAPVAQQQASLAVPPKPIANVAAPTFFSTSYPDAVRGPVLPPSDWSQGGFTDSVDTAGADWSFPDSFPPPWRPASTFTTAFAPERTQVYIDQDFPDRIPRAPAVAQQQDAAARPLAPERTSTYLDQDFPDRVLRAPAVAQQQDAAARPLAPERSAPLASQSYPDRIDRPGSAPDSVTLWPKPIPNVAAPVSAYASYPERIDRVGGLRTANQQDAAARNLVPIVFVRNWDLTSYPVSVPGAQRVAQQQDQAARPVAPESKLPAPYLSYPDRVLGAPFPTSEQQHVAALPTKPEEPVPVTYGSYPDRVPAALAVAQQQAAAALPLAPEVKTPSDWRTSYPDRVDGPRQPQYFAATEVGLPPSAPTYFGVSYPDIVRGRGFAAYQQQAFTGPVAPPPAPVVPSFVQGSYPDAPYRVPWIAAYWSATTAMLVIGPTPPTVLLLPPTSTSTSVVPTSSSYAGITSSSS